MKGKYTLYILISVIVVGCSTSKNTWLSRGYHNLTAKYNVFFNGEQSFEKGRESMRESIRDDYTHILPMFAFSEEVDADVPTSQMQRAIRKGHKLIGEHSITAKPKREPTGGDPEYREFYRQKEFNRWVDDSWMLIGKAHMHLHQWREAARAFDQVIGTFPQKSVRFEAMLWLARAYIEMDDFESARRHLDWFSSGIDDEKNYAALASSTYAWFWLSRGNYSEALDYCRQAAEETGDRWQRIRWYYVLGQVAERTDNLVLARDAYQKVVRMNPDYEFQIHAKIKGALLEGGPRNPEISRRELEKFPDEYKNRPYRDQIYYALAQTWFWEEDTLNALTNLQLAAGYGEGNQTLSGEVYRQMAEIYFNSGEYIAAHAYYDSTLNVLPGDYENIEGVRRKKKKLAPLAQSLQTIQYEDSVQRIATLPEAERDQFIDELLVQLEQEEEEKRMGGDAGSSSSFYRNFSGNQRRNTGQSDQWYFYNQAMLSLGKMEFEKRWGRRELEDNWRRSGKSDESSGMAGSAGDGNMMPSDPFSQGPPGPGISQTGSDATRENGVPDRESLLEGLPLSGDEMLESHRREQKALFNAANVLAYNFGKYREAVATYEQLLSQYPQNPYREQTLMGIYLACREINDQQCVDHYGQVILDDYPGSRFARFVANPRFLEDMEMVRQEMEDLYQSAYQDFKNASWKDAIEKTEEIINGTFQQLVPQAALLNAISQSQLGKAGLFRQRLESIVENFPNSSQANVAEHWLALLEEGRQPADVKLPDTRTVSADGSPGGGGLAESKTSGEDVAKSRFRMEPDSAHYVMTVLEQGADVNQFLFHLANFNFDHYTRNWLQLEVSGLGNEFNLVETGPFGNSQSGLTYFYSLLDNPSLFRIDDAGEPVVLLISEGNREKLETSGDLESYIEFFLENYLPGNNSSAIVLSESEVPENNYLETREPENVSVFSANQGEVWGMIIVSGEDGDVDEARSFLPGMTRSVLRERVSVSEETLPGGHDVLLIKEFENPADFEELASALDENSFWQSRVKGEDWVICPVSSENFQLLKNEEGSLEEYLDFVGK